MIYFYKRSLNKAALMLSMLKKNPDDYLLLTRLQRFLISLIVRNEKTIISFKKDLAENKKSLKIGRCSKHDSIKIKASINALEEKINVYKHLIYIWKCFGDGIVFLYLDKYALKHAYLDSNGDIKEHAGFISGKEGFKKEWSIVLHANKEKLPTVLCDVTNVLRHGDVCLLIGPDPFLMEI